MFFGWQLIVHESINHVELTLKENPCEHIFCMIELVPHDLIKEKLIYLTTYQNKKVYAP